MLPELFEYNQIDYWINQLFYKRIPLVMIVLRFRYRFKWYPFWFKYTIELLVVLRFLPKLLYDDIDDGNIMVVWKIVYVCKNVLLSWFNEIVLLKTYKWSLTNGNLP